MLLGCEILFGRQYGAEVQTLVERLTGGPCPCRQGHTCPLLMSDAEVPTQSCAPVEAKAAGM